jgi:hypothetical protein
MQGCPNWGPCMQNKRYQVFVSSTYMDLKDERRSVIETLLDLDCIPAGMEWFGAIDEEQFEYIKRVIDDCDYYVVIIGGRYGTISADGASYTEKEYDYAVSKGLKVLAFVHNNPSIIASGKTELDTKSRKKLEKFKAKVKKGRLVELWEGKDQLAGKVATSMARTQKMHPAVGWVRANQVASVENLTEVNELRKENEHLKMRLSELSAKGVEGIAGLDETITVHGMFKPPPRIKKGYSTIEYPAQPWELTITWSELFALIAPEIMSLPNDHLAKTNVASCLFAKTGEAGGHSINDQDFQTIKVHLMALGLLECPMLNTKNGTTALFWRLSEAGRRTMLETRSVKSSAAKLGALPPEVGQ